MDWYLNVLKNYFGFGGRARRKEYWMFVLVNIIFSFVLSIWTTYLAGNAPGRRRINDDLWCAGIYTVVGSAIPSFA